MVVGQGNPGARYVSTRHNIGFLVVDALARTLRPVWYSEPSYRYALADDEGREVALVKPLTYMNASGMAVKTLLGRFDAAPEDLLVILDDVRLPLGRIRLRRGGSDGGHNGLVSIIQSLGAPGFPRLRLGVGPPPEGKDTIDFVLGVFPPDEQETVSEMVGRATDAVRAVLKDGLEKAMNQFNG
jgi:PTH1 family peptidyl-tRNA hydrolase